jgi:acetyl-CoA acyltransferase
MSEEKALELGYKPLAYLRDWSFKACDPFEELLLVSSLWSLLALLFRLLSNRLTYFTSFNPKGPTYCSQEVLTRNKLDLESDIGVFEIHEAFAGQILSNIEAMKSQKFADEKFGGKRVGDIDMGKMNTKGGSLALGHPFGATGSRLITTASRRLQLENQRFALVAACADGGLGHACILERYD